MSTSNHCLPSLVGLFTLLLTSAGAFAEHKVVAYVPNWIDLPAFADTIDYAKLTHINVAFENPVNDAGDLSFKPANEALIRRARASRVKVLVSIGGGAAADHPVLRPRYARLLNEDNRAAFVGRLADYVVKHHFDGLDVDIEGPSIDQHYGPFVADLANALRPKGKLLTAALSKGYGGRNVPDATLDHFDFVNIMAYDGTGPWAPKRPGQHASMEFARENVGYWLGRGLPKSKAVLGVPFYGYGFGDAFRKRDYPYREIVAAHPGAEDRDHAGGTIWYNGIPTIKAKARYVADEGLGGVMIWSLDSDAPGERSLLSAIHAALAAAPATRPADVPGPPAKERFKVFLLVGQSNMAGRGQVEAQDKEPHPRVLMLTKEDRWAPAVSPLHFDKPAIAGVGPGLAFGKVVAEAMPGDTIGLVPCAVGGTGIDQWKQGGKLYDDAVRRAKAALKDGGVLGGVLWHQGESDQKKPDEYAAKAAKLFADLREDLGAADVPVVVGTLGEWREEVNAINAVLRKLPEAVPHCGVADANGLTDKGDRLHFDAASARELGKRYAAAWMRLAKAEEPAKLK